MCRQWLIANGRTIPTGASVYRAPVSGPTIAPYPCGGDVVVNIVGISAQIAPWDEPHAGFATFDANWNPVNVGNGACYWPSL
jgi:hypothetical protein